jgi:hypothetical protein
VSSALITRAGQAMIVKAFRAKSVFTGLEDEVLHRAAEVSRNTGELQSLPRF